MILRITHPVQPPQLTPNPDTLTTILTQLASPKRILPRTEVLPQTAKEIAHKALRHVLRLGVSALDITDKAQRIVDFPRRVGVDGVRAVRFFEVLRDQSWVAVTNHDQVCAWTLLGENCWWKRLREGEEVLLAVSAEEVADEDDYRACVGVGGRDQVAEFYGLFVLILHGEIIEFGDSFSAGKIIAAWC